jgi:triacylglycerol lipase
MAINSKHLVDPALLRLLDFFPPLELNDDILPAIRGRGSPAPVDDGGDGREVDAAVGVGMRTIPGPDGAAEVGVVIHTPRGMQQPLPCVVHIHGGGFVLGSAAAMQVVHRKLAAAAGCVIVSVDYRLAPETRFPGAIEDCYAALAWVHREAAALGVDPARIGVMGESAGGCLAAALALLARDRREYAVAFQHLIYPMLDDRTCVHADPQPYAGEFLWTPLNNRFGWSSVLGVPPGSAGVSPYAAPARAGDLAGLPPAFISCGALDLLIEEDLEYARRLMRSGVPVELHVYPGAFHGFDLSPDAPVAMDARRDSLAALRRSLKSA